MYRFSSIEFLISKLFLQGHISSCFNQVNAPIVKMKLLQSTSVFALLFKFSLALPKDYDGNAIVRDMLEMRQGTAAVQDCGEWKMKCKNAAGACNNACYYVNCIAKNNKYVSSL
jgi:hypothetical protein